MESFAETQINPYESPQAETPEDDGAGMQKPTPLRSLGKWTLICCLSAGPSFFWGQSIHSELGLVATAAMLAGIGVFVLLYTVAENLPEVQRQVEELELRNILRFGYTVRVAVSLIVPVGLAVDMLVGMFAVGIVNRIFPAETSVPISLAETSFFRIFVTTLVQGVLLNGLLFLLMGCIYVILLLERRFRSL